MVAPCPSRGRVALRRVAGRRGPEPDSPESGALHGGTRAQALAAIRTLPRRQRDVVLLRFYLDMTEAEIAGALGVSAGTVKTSAHRALRTLAPLLAELR